MKCINFFLLALSLTATLMMSCESAPDDLFVRHFLIRKGEHYATSRAVELLQSDRLRFKATFDESAVYDLGDPALQTNKNKLMGFSDCNAMHHENSARFAWQWFNGQLEIHAYCYVNSVRVEKFVGVVSLNEENSYEIVRTRTEYIFILNGETRAAISRYDGCNTGVYYMLYPYFGGSVPAPHDVRIDITVEH